MNYANEFNTHPAMIVGRLQHLGLIHFSAGHQFIVPVNLADADNDPAFSVKRN